MLGAGQLAWLKRELKASRATFKVLVSGTGWSIGRTRRRQLGAYPGRARRRSSISSATNRIAGCFGISGDVHMGEANCVPWSEKGGYDFYDLVSSGLAQVLSDKFVDQLPEVRLRAPFTGGAEFRRARFQFRADAAGHDERAQHVRRGPCSTPIG